MVHKRMLVDIMQPHLIEVFQANYTIAIVVVTHSYLKWWYVVLLSASMKSRV